MRRELLKTTREVRKASVADKTYAALFISRIKMVAKHKKQGKNVLHDIADWGDGQAGPHGSRHYRRPESLWYHC